MTDGILFFSRDVNEMVMICLQDQQRLLSNEVRNTCREVFSRLYKDLFHAVVDFIFVLVRCFTRAKSLV